MDTFNIMIRGDDHDSKLFVPTDFEDKKALNRGVFPGDVDASDEDGYS